MAEATLVRPPIRLTRAVRPAAEARRILTAADLAAATPAVLITLAAVQTAPIPVVPALADPQHRVLVARRAEERVLVRTNRGSKYPSHLGSFEVSVR